MLDLMNAAGKMGLRCSGFEVSALQLTAVKLPAILHWDQQLLSYYIGLKTKYIILRIPL